MKMWYKFYECECNTEGIMLGYDHEEENFPQIDLAFFQHGIVGRHPLDFWKRFKWAWYLIKTGLPFIDQVILDQKTAKELGEDLLKFANKKFEPKDKKR